MSNRKTGCLLLVLLLGFTFLFFNVVGFIILNAMATYDVAKENKLQLSTADTGDQQQLTLETEGVAESYAEVFGPNWWIPSAVWAVTVVLILGLLILFSGGSKSRDDDDPDEEAEHDDNTVTITLD